MKNLLQTLWKITKYAGRFLTIFRNTILNTVFLFVLIIFLITVFKSDKEKETAQQIPENSILRVSIVGSIVEQRPFPEPLQKILNNLNDSKEQVTFLQDVLDAVNYAAEDPKIGAILLNTQKMSAAGLNQLQSIGEALHNFRSSGRQVIAAADSYSQGEYFLASHADRILLNPMGSVDIRGMARHSLYFKDALDKLKITYNVFKAGSYKSAIEPFTRNSMSVRDKQQSYAWLSALWSDYSSKVTKNRNLALNALDIYTSDIDKKLQEVHGDTAQLAHTTGLVDALATRQAINDHMHSLTGLPKERKINYIQMQEYLDLQNRPRSYTQKTGEIGVIIAEGMILDGRQQRNQIGAENLIKLIAEARNNPKVEALVLRLNSGGGSAFASELIRQELLQFKASGKKLIVSMGTIAASGGYWIAADADQIWASSSTLTGSIGVFGALPTFDKSLASLGVYSDGVATTPLAQGAPFIQPLTPTIRSILQQTVEHTYSSFLNIVTEGRGIEAEQVAHLAQGKVYDGEKAKSIGLIDELGDLTQAIEAVKTMIGNKEATAFYIQPKSSIQQQLMKMFGSIRYSLLTLLAGEELGSLVHKATQEPEMMIIKNHPDRNNIYSYIPPFLLGTTLIR